MYTYTFRVRISVFIWLFSLQVPYIVTFEMYVSGQGDNAACVALVDTFMTSPLPDFNAILQTLTPDAVTDVNYIDGSLDHTLTVVSCESGFVQVQFGDDQVCCKCDTLRSESIYCNMSLLQAEASLE